MDVRELKQLLSTAATGSLILMGSGVVMAGDLMHEQPSRPHMSAACSPNWGFNQTCWSRFPAVSNCPDHGGDFLQEGYENPPARQNIYAPQNSLLLPNSQIIPPEYGSIQSPISVFPNSSPAATGGAATGNSAMPPLRNTLPSTSNPPQFAPGQPLNAPAGPNMRTFPPAPGSGALNALPPLPSPPVSVPDQSSLQRSYRSSGSRQPALGFAHSSQNLSRYGNTRQSASMVDPYSLTNALLVNTRQMPATDPAVPGIADDRISLASQSRVIPIRSQPLSSYRSAAAMPAVSAASQSQFVPAQLPQTPNYQTISSESLRSAP